MWFQIKIYFLLKKDVNFFEEISISRKINCTLILVIGIFVTLLSLYYFLICMALPQFNMERYSWKCKVFINCITLCNGVLLYDYWIYLYDQQNTP